MNITKPFGVCFDFLTGLSGDHPTTKRYLSNLTGMFADGEACEDTLKRDDPLIYEFHEMDITETPGDIAFGMSILYPGKVGDEYYMTKGHFHTILDTAEVYLCMQGRGVILLENPEGDWAYELLEAGKMVYVPKRYAHRSINIGKEPFVQFFCFRADAGHDYGSIETRGYRKLVVEKDNGYAIVDNPKWR